MNFQPSIIAVNKPVRLSSNHVVSYFKRNLPDGYGKIGHFGTLDPFASGLLLIGIAGAAKLNDYIHSLCPKTYLAVGKLGLHTDSLDHTTPVTARDDSQYFTQEISQFSKEFLQKMFFEKFVGQYYQAPQYYSAAKFQGRPLYEWARSGVLVKKEEKKREIFHLNVVKYQFPYITFEVTVSSGTYIRTLFKDMANLLGTHGILIALNRTAIGGIDLKQAVKKKQWPVKHQRFDQAMLIPVESALPLNSFNVSEENLAKLKNGQTVNEDSGQFQLHHQALTQDYFWLKGNELIGMGKCEAGKVKVVFNFPLS